MRSQGLKDNRIEQRSSATESAGTTGVKRFRLRYAWAILMRTGQAFLDADTSLRCAGTAFFGFLSLFPAIGIVAFAYGLIADVSTFISTIETLKYLVPSSVLGVVREQLAILVTQPPASLGIGLTVSVVLALWSGSRGVNALIYAMSRVRGEPERRGLLKTTAFSVLLTVIGAVFLAISLVTIAGLPALLPFPSGSDLLLLALRWPVLLILATLVLSAVYRWGPDRHPRRFRYILPGAVAASLLWLLAGAVFSIYVENFSNYQASFGSVSAAVVLLLWLYNSAQIFVLGAALNTQIERAATDGAAVSGIGADH